MSAHDPHVNVFVPPVVPGGWWICPNGHRHFVCAWCGRTFLSDTDITEEDRRREELIVSGKISNDPASICDGCYPVIVAKGREQGLFP